MAVARIGWAIAGTGNIARRFAEDMRFSSHGQVVAVASSDPRRGRAMADAIGTDVFSGEFGDILTHPAVDAVYIAGRNELHCEQAIRSLEKGKPVLIEKPFATSLAEAELIAEASRSLRVLAMEAMWMRFMPAMRSLKQRIDQGEIGRVRSIQASLSFANPRPAAAVTPDLGVYPISLAIQLLGPPRSVAASTTPDGRQAAIALTYPEALAALVCGFDGEGANRATIVGSKGLIMTDAPLFAPTVLSVRRTAPVSRPVTTGPLAAHPRLPWRDALRSVIRPFRDRRNPVPYRGNGLHYQADHFAECLAAGLIDSPIMPLGQSIEVIHVVERVGRLLAPYVSGIGSKLETGR